MGKKMRDSIYDLAGVKTVNEVGQTHTHVVFHTQAHIHTHTHADTLADRHSSLRSAIILTRYGEDISSVPSCCISHQRDFLIEILLRRPDDFAGRLWVSLLHALFFFLLAGAR